MIHERGYWLSKKEVNQHYFDKDLAETICLMFPVQTAVDIGCGNGMYTKYLNEHGIKCVGYDGSPLTPLITNNLCEVKDFSIPQNIGKFDLVLSLEVGEHIPQKYEQIFIDNLCKASNNYLVISWAIIGQKGIGHVNCKDNDYVMKEITDRGFVYKLADSTWLRECSTLSWFVNTLMVFKRK